MGLWIETFYDDSELMVLTNGPKILQGYDKCFDFNKSLMFGMLSRNCQSFKITSS